MKKDTLSTQKWSKLNQLLAQQPKGTVMLSTWLAKQGYSPALQKRYKKSNWLTAIGPGAMIRFGDPISYEGAIYALQQQGDLTIHPAGKTALSLQGKTHYLELGSGKLTLFGSNKEKLPSWFLKYDWGKLIDYHTTSFLPSDLGMTNVELNDFSIKVSSPARAVLECLYLVPHKQELIECYELCEGLNNLKPQSVQALLEKCTSIKAKRLFMYLFEKTGHEWVKYVNLQKVDFGTGKRSIVKNGVYISKYQITVPKELEDYGSKV